MCFKIYIKQNIRIYLLISYIRTKKEGISQVSPSSGKSEKSLIYAKKANLLARKYAILRKSILLPKSVPIIAKRFINAEKYSFIAKRFNYAELYQLSGHYTVCRQGLEPIISVYYYSAI